MVPSNQTPTFNMKVVVQETGLKPDTLAPGKDDTVCRIQSERPEAIGSIRSMKLIC